MKRCLIISYYYPPIVSPRAFRWHAIARQWAQQGYSVDVVCAWLPQMPDSEMRDGVTVHHVNVRWLERLRAAFIRSSPLPAESTSPPAQPKKPSLIRRMLKPPLLWLYNNVYTRLYWPDDGFLWYLPAVAKVRALMAQHEYDAIISVSLHFTAHLVGEQAHALAPRIPWLVDIGDPFAPMKAEAINNRLYAGLNRRAEARILNSASAVTVTTAGTQALYEQFFPAVSGKISVIPPLLSLPAPTDEGGQIFPDNDRIRLVFIGTLYPTIRRPDFLLAVFAQLLHTSLADRLELHFFGYVTPVADAFDQYAPLIDQKIFVHGTVSREQAQYAMQDADLLVNIGNTTAYQLPSKVVEYAATGKRVLNIAQIDDDSSAAFFANYPLALCLHQHETIDDAASRLHDFLINVPPAMSASSLADFLYPFQPETIARAYHDRLYGETT